ncbi:VOC family protein [Methylobrevis albus]|uniref:VOC family protein n=1 Tax=Methylobrevis albus TaxID=2793297 RepID=A0A931N146_9HYPH|nr:VOC family protein [Methylobrevis albus]MBH0239919.1 VOC family protein [Methylobrevis albus]
MADDTLTTPLSPHIVCEGAAAAIDWYVKVFGAEELVRMPRSDGRIMHAALRLSASTLMLMDADPSCGAVSPKALGGSPVTLHLYVDDVDVVIADAVLAGARLLMPASDMFWGDRYGVVEDPFGHRWSLATQKRDLSLAELREAAKQAFCNESGPQPEQKAGTEAAAPLHV